MKPKTKYIDKPPLIFIKLINLPSVFNKLINHLKHKMCLKWI